jgi:hypothetical protein
MVHYRYRETIYHITVTQTSDNNAANVIVDNVQQPDTAIFLVDDHQEHSVEVRIDYQKKLTSTAPSSRAEAENG